jgi:hypothetical protein
MTLELGHPSSRHTFKVQGTSKKLLNQQSWDHQNISILIGLISTTVVETANHCMFGYITLASQLTNKAQSALLKFD